MEECFSRFLNCTNNATKSRNASYIYMQYLRQNTEKTCYVKTLKTCIFLYMHSKRNEMAGQKNSKSLAFQIYEITKHGAYEK